MADADKIAENGDNSILTKGTDAVAVIDKPAEEITNGVVPAVGDQEAKKTADVNSAEETRIRLAKAKEELLKAREESARARDEVEKAKKDLEVAKLDTTLSSQPAAADSTPAPDAEIKIEPATEEVKPAVPAVVTEAVTETAAPISSEEVKTSATEEVKTVTVRNDVQLNPTESEALSTNSVAAKAIPKVDKEESKTVPVENVKEAPAEKLAEPVPEQAAPEAGAAAAEPAVEPVANVEEDNGDAGIEEGEVSDGELHAEGGEEEDEGVDVDGEREEGDGEESGDEAAAKPLDDDEDRRNPQYIPKKGGFYEHDDRTHEEEGGEAAPEEPVEDDKPKKSMRSEAVDRWGHDMFDENQQGPKNDQELIDLYGYDIRQEEGAPRARRRRRYGRGPNKYDRTWEDEEAYSRPRGRGGASTGQRGGPSTRGVERSGGTERSERGGGSERGSRAERGGERGPERGPRPRPAQRQDAPKREDFPPLPDQTGAEPAGKVHVESGTVFNSSSANWRDGAGAMSEDSGSQRRGENKASAISFRRGGRGRTFEERNKTKTVRSRTDDAEPSFENAGNDSTMTKDKQKSPRGGPDAPPRGGGNFRGGRGAPRGGAGTGPSPRGGSASSYRGRRSGDNSSHWEEGNTKISGSTHQSHGHRGGSSGGAQGVHTDQHRGSFEEQRGRGRGKFGRSQDSHDSHPGQVTHGMEQMRIDDHQSSRNQDAVRSKRYSSQRQRMTTPPPAATGGSGGGMPQPPFAGNAAYYQSYNESPPANYVPAPPASMMGPPMVAAQPNPTAFIAPPIYPAAPGPAPFAPGPYQGYPPAPAPPPVGVPISSPTQENMYGGGIMYYDPGRQPMHHGAQPPRRPKAAIPIVAPTNEAESYMMSGRRGPHE